MSRDIDETSAIDRTAEMPEPKPEPAPEHKTPLDSLAREWQSKLEHREELASAFAEAQARLAAWDQELMEHAHQVRGLADTILASHPSAPVPPEGVTAFAVPPGRPQGNGEWRRPLSRRQPSPDSPHPGWTVPPGSMLDGSQLAVDTAQMPQYDEREAPTQPMERMDPPVRGAHRSDGGGGRDPLLWVIRVFVMIAAALLAPAATVFLTGANERAALLPFGFATVVLLVPIAVGLHHPLQRWLGPYWRWVQASVYAAWTLVLLELLMSHSFWPDVNAAWYVAVIVVAELVHSAFEEGRMA